MLYAYLPSPLLAVVLGRIRELTRPILLLASAWPKQPWYSTLLELLVTHTVRIPLDQYLQLQGN